jgi:hypothetical protein
MRPYLVVHSQQQMCNALEHKKLGPPGGYLHLCAAVLQTATKHRWGCILYVHSQ